VATDKICGRSLSSKIPVDTEQHIYETMSHDQRDQGHIARKYEVIFVGFPL
jgi:hypothetical protein